MAVQTSEPSRVVAWARTHRRTRSRARSVDEQAERVDVEQLEFELEFAAKLAELDALSKRREPLPESVAGGSSTPRAPKKPTGRRDFSELDLPEETSSWRTPRSRGRRGGTASASAPR